MKALLFTLLLVAFMCEDPVSSLKCYMCGRAYCNWKMHCVENEKFCVTLIKPNGFQRDKGCAKWCPGEAYGKLLECCQTDFCNRA